LAHLRIQVVLLRAILVPPDNTILIYLLPAVNNALLGHRAVPGPVPAQIVRLELLFPRRDHLAVKNVQRDYSPPMSDRFNVTLAPVEPSRTLLVLLRVNIVRLGSTLPICSPLVVNNAHLVRTALNLVPVPAEIAHLAE